MQEALEQLFERFRRSGEPAALAEVYDRTAAELLRVALHLSGEPAAAEDLVQATFLTAIEKAADYTTDARLLPWLVGILQLHAKEWNRREARRPSAERLRTETIEVPQELAANEEFTAALDQAISRLPDSLQPVLVLRLRHGMSPVDIAHALRRPPGTVRAQLARGLQKVRRSLPAGFAAALAGILLPARGVAAVRAVVLQHAAAQAVAAGATATSAGGFGGWLIMKKVLVACVFVVGGVTAWGFWPASAPAPAPATFEPVVEAGQRAAPTDAALAQREAETIEAQRAELEAPPELPTRPRVASIAESDARCSVVVRVRFASDAKPAAGVYVRMHDYAHFYDDFDGRVAVTDASGTVRFTDLDPGYWSAEADRGGRDNVLLAPGVERNVAIEIPDGIDVRGTVVDGQGQPVAGAQVWLSRKWTWQRGRVVTKADRNGEFVLRSVGKDHYLGARARGRTPSAMLRVVGEPGSTFEPQFVVAGSGASVSGRVTDRAGKPVVRAAVMIGREDPEHRVRGSEGATPDWAPFLRWTDEDGRFAAEGLGLGEYPVQVRRAGFAPWRKTINVTPGAAIRTDAVLDKSVTLRGTVTDAAGKPLAGAMIIAFAQDPDAPLEAYDDVMSNGAWREFRRVKVASGAGGHYELDQLPVGSVRLVASKRNHGQAADTRFANAGAELEWSPRLSVSLQLHGRVEDGAGRSLAGWGVRISREDGADVTARGPRYHFSTTAKDGSFAFDRRPAVAHRVVVFEPSNGSRKRFEQSGVQPGVPVVLTVTDATEASGSIVGRLIDTGGVPISGAKVTVWCGEHELSKSAISAPESGVFEVTALPAGKYWVRVAADDYPWLNLGFKEVPDAAPLRLGDVRLQTGVRLGGRIDVTDPVLLPSLRLRLIGRSGEAADIAVRGGEYRSGPVAAGKYDLIVDGPGIASQRVPVELAGSRDHQLDIGVRPGVAHVVEAVVPGAPASLRYAHATVFDTSGAMVGAETAHRAGEIFRAELWLQPGSYRLVVTVGPGTKKGEQNIVVGTARATTRVTVQ